MERFPTCKAKNEHRARALSERAQAAQRANQKCLGADGGRTGAFHPLLAAAAAAAATWIGIKSAPRARPSAKNRVRPFNWEFMTFVFIFGASNNTGWTEDDATSKGRILIPQLKARTLPKKENRRLSFFLSLFLPLPLCLFPSFPMPSPHLSRGWQTEIFPPSFSDSDSDRPNPKKG